MDFIETKNFIESKLQYGDKRTVAQKSRVKIGVVNNMLKCTDINKMTAVQKECWINMVNLIMDREERLNKSLKRIEEAIK